MKTTQKEQLKNADRYKTRGGRQFAEILETDLLSEVEMRAYFLTNVLKYLIRREKKDGVFDLQKSKTYLEMWIEFEDKIAAESAESRAYIAQ